MKNLPGIIAALACIFCVGIGLSISLPLLSILMERAGVSAAANGVNATIIGLGTLCITPFATSMIRRLGIRTSATISAGIAAISTIIFAMAESSGICVIGRFLLGASTGFLFILSEFQVSRLASPEQRGLILGIYGSVVALGFLTGPAILIATGTQGSLPFLIIGLSFACCIVPLHCSQELYANSRDCIEENEKTKKKLSFLFASPIAILASFIFGATETAVQVLLPIYAVRIGYEENLAILMVFMTVLGGMIMSVPLGALSDRIGSSISLFLCGCIAMISIALLLIPSIPPWKVRILLFLFGGSIRGLYTIGIAQLTSIFKGIDQASAIAIFVSLHSIGTITGPFVIGFCMETWSNNGFVYGILAHFLAFTCILSIRSFLDFRPRT